MDARSVLRFAVGCLAVASVGCGAMRPFQPVPPQPGGADKSSQPRFDYRSGTPYPPPQAGRQDTWPQPENVRTNYAEPPPGGGQLPPPQPYPNPNGQPYPRPNGYGPQPGDPNYRVMPTATGEKLALAPHETAMDRAVELIRKVEQVSAENQALQARVRLLEASAEARETALTETLRDVETATAEVTRTRTELNNLRRDLTALKNQVAMMERSKRDDTETLKMVAAALEKLLQVPERK